MADPIKPGTWVEIESIVLEADERAPQVPDDTARLPLEMRVKGFLVSTGIIGEEVEIETMAGRKLRGTLAKINPSYTHGFGAPIPELWTIGPEVRAILRKRSDPT